MWFSGSVALAAPCRGERSSRPGVRSRGPFVEGFGKSGGRRNVDSEIVEASAEVLDEGMAGEDDPGGTVSLQSSHGSKPAFRRPWSVSMGLLA